MTVNWERLVGADGDDLTAAVHAAARSGRADLLESVRALPEPRLWDRVRHAADASAAVTTGAGTLAAMTDLVDAARDELAALWRDLANDRRHALNGVWSMGCENRVFRIARLTLLVGPCPWTDVEPEPLRDGTYRALHAALGIDPGIDEAALAAFLDRDAEDRAAALASIGNRG